LRGPFRGGEAEFSWNGEWNKV